MSNPLVLLLCGMLLVIGGFYVLQWTTASISPRTLPREHERVIPLNIFQTWHTKKLPPKMQGCIDSIKRDNPEFTHYLFDDQECQEFLRRHFDADVLLAYQTLLPAAYRSDLWRYCVLYIHGGVYLDVKYRCVNGFRFHDLVDDEYFVMDRYHFLDKLAVYNALIVAKPGNPILYKCIRRIVENVQNRYYGETALDITGPTMMIQFFTPNDKKKLKRLFFTDDGGIVYQGRYILKTYPEYRREQRQYSAMKSYVELWNTRNVFV